KLRAGKILACFCERWNEMRMLGRGKRHHGIAVGKWREMLLQFVRRTAGRDEMNFIEIKAAIRGACNRQMSIVDGIERAAKQREAARVMFCCSAALGLRGSQLCS